MNAEDPDRDFAPSPGRIARLVLPAGPGIRVDTGVAEGDEIPSDFDSMIAKVIAYGRDRDEALARLRRAMAETTVLIEGGATNKTFVLDLLGQPEEVVDGSADTGWIDRVRGQGRLVAHRGAGVALAAAAIEAYRVEEEVARQGLLASAHGGRPQVHHEVGRALELKLRGVGYRVGVGRIGARRFRVGVGLAGGGVVRSADVEVERFDAHSGLITVNGSRFRLVTGTYGPTHLVEVDGVMHRVSLDKGGVVRSPWPGLVVATPVGVDDEVDSGDPIVVLESMKMETVLRAPFRARVRELPVSVGSQIATGTPLMRLEPLGGEDETPAPSAETQAIEIELPVGDASPSAAERVERARQDLLGMLLGYDLDPGERDRALAEYLAAREELGEANRPLAGELDLLRAFADLSELSRNKPAGELPEPTSHVHSPREFFHSYLQSLDAERAGVTESFQAKLTQVLAHYGVTDLARTPELEAAVFRIFLAQQRAAADVEVVSALLRRWLAEAPPAGELRERVGLMLEHLVEATQVRFPQVWDWPAVVFRRWFAMPLLRRSRAEAYAEVRRDLEYLERNPDAPDRGERIAAMVAVAEPLVRLMSRRIGRPGYGTAPLLEVLTRRYYGNKALREVRTRDLSGIEFVTAQTNGHTHIATGAVEFPELPVAVGALGAFARDLPESAAVVADLYLRWDAQPDVDAMAAQLREVIAEAGLPGQIERITASVAAVGAGMHHHFTFRPDHERGGDSDSDGFLTDIYAHHCALVDGSRTGTTLDGFERRNAA